MKLKHFWHSLLIVICIMFLVGCSTQKTAKVQENKTTDQTAQTETKIVTRPSLADLQNKYKNVKAKNWGEIVPGVMTVVPGADKVIFLTFDACGGKGGSQCDTKLLEFLEQEKVPATFFINSRWIEANKDLTKRLANNPLFSIQNHGTGHCPLTITGRSIYKIKGTVGIQGVYEEIMGDDAEITKVTGKTPRFFRSGTAYYDEVAVKIARDLGYTVIGFDILGDAGATYSATQIERVAQKAKSGSIIIYHMNQPQSSTCKGVKLVVKDLRAKGFSFGKIEDYI
jgi:peptidoglycan/xylan/chitin deacetylase (PgdA/CDA1 family)